MRCGVYVRVSTDDQRDNGYSIDSQLRMIKEYCEKNDYDIVDVYNDAGHSGKDLMRPEMQRLLKDIKSKKIDKLIAIKVDRLTRNNYDGFWLLNYCEEHDVKIELILEFLEKQYHTYSDVEITTVKTGDEINLGGKTLAIVSAPMLHWPDSMFVMYAEEGILFSNDAFGQHLCLSKRYAEDYSEDFILKAAKKFFANLVVLGAPMLRMKFQELTEAGIVEQIKMIAPCHGQIWKDPSKIIQAYSDWASGVCEDKITIVYDTMHHSTEKLAFQIAEGIMSEGIEAVMYHMESDYESEVVSDILDSKAIALGAPTMMNKPFPRIGNLMYWLDCLNFKGTTSEKNALIFSSKGWGGGAVSKLQRDLEEAGFTVTDTLDVLFVPDEDVLAEAFEKGAELARSIKE